MTEALAIGTWRAASRPDDFKAMLDRLSEYPVDVIDTASVYGPGVEAMLRDAIHGNTLHSDRLVLKVGFLPGGKHEFVVDCSAQSIRDQTERALSALGVENVGVLALHGPDHQLPIDEQLGTVADLVAEGKASRGGFCNAPAPSGGGCEGWHYQMEFSVTRPGALLELERARQQGWRSFGYAPLGAGALTEPASLVSRMAARHSLSPAGLLAAYYQNRFNGILRPLFGPKSERHLDELAAGIAAAPDGLEEAFRRLDRQIESRNT